MKNPNRLFPTKTTLSSLAICAFLFAPSSNAQTVRDVTYLLPAPIQNLAFGPWLIAQKKGYYADENLNVRFMAANGGVDVAKQVGAGNALVGGAIGDTPILARAQGIPVRDIAVLGGGSLTLIATHHGGAVKTLSDLKGKTVTVMSYADTTYFSLLGALSTAGLTKQELSIEAAGPAAAWQLFAAGRSDALAGPPNFIASAEYAGAKVDILPSPGFTSMAQSIVASDKAIREQPDLLGRLVKATLRGMADIVDDPAAATATYIAANPNYKGKEALVRRVFDMYRQYTFPGQKSPGFVDPARLDALQKFYVSQHIVTRATPLNELYTNQFIPK
ncbi:MAG: ABC transporter substrate-binding protein [Paraburkholderia sp.]|jgi:NitT/TauT family transport system substrate-binding protein|nr:ABC transporter substrate-binding protein [Paraburkholderia sp.]